MSAPEEPGTPRTASLPRRFAAWLVDWALCLLIVFGFLPYDVVLEPGVEPPLLLGVPESSWALMGVFAALNVVLVGITGSTVGHRLLGLQVWQVRPGSFPLQVVVRTALLCLFVPAVVTRSDGRGWHDSVAGTRIVRL
ncbi:MAG TPA: RDD family protein [Ornithinibacter sp.]|nr:RDD family protein [Ornithinibacter sp.]